MPHVYQSENPVFLKRESTLTFSGQVGLFCAFSLVFTSGAGRKRDRRKVLKDESSIFITNTTTFAGQILSPSRLLFVCSFLGPSQNPLPAKENPTEIDLVFPAC
jgi:hypothetical protein